MNETRFVLSLSKLGRDDVPRAGGKAANLGEMMAAGLPVPDGFCVTCDAYRAHLAVHELEADIASLVSQSHERPLAELAEEIRRRIAHPPLPLEVAEEILAACSRLQGQVAVRSSATAEDLAGTSFAGQHDTFLNVRPEAVLDHVRACWSSLWSERAVSYRRQSGVDPADLAMACVVQQMVPAAVAGVAFTADPVTGDRDRIIINAVAGLGEALVSGQATADQYVIRKSDGEVLTRQVHQPDAPAEPWLDAIVSLAASVERHYGAPQDIEWAVADGTLALLQARPITNLPPEPVSLAEAERPLRAFFVRIREMMPGPFTPLGGDLFGHVIFPWIFEGAERHGFTLRGLMERAPTFAKFVNGRMYADLAFTRDLVYLAVDEELHVLRLMEEARFPPLRELRPRKLLQWRLQYPRSLFCAVRYACRIDRHAAEALAAVEKPLATLEEADFTTWSREQLVAVLRGQWSDELRRHGGDVLTANGQAAAFSEIFYKVLTHIVTRWAGESPSSAASLVSGLTGIAEVECTKMLWKLARQAREIPEVAQALEGDPQEAWKQLQGLAAAAGWLEGFRLFLRRYGHRAIEEVELTRPRWSEQPAFLLTVVANYMHAPDDADPEVTERRLVETRKAVEQRILGRLRWRPLRRWLFRRCLDLMQKVSVVRQNTKCEFLRFGVHARRATLELGRRLVEEGQLGRAEDAAFLHLDELGEPRDYRAQVAERRRLFAQWQRQGAPRIIDARGRAVRDAVASSPISNEAEDGMLRGIGSSPGRARGRVHIVLDPSNGARLQPGEILVAPYTDPAWTPLFVSAAAVVVEIGSLLSHASIVARETGVPSVVAVENATRLLHDGDLVEVDGEAGTVRRVT